MVVSSKEWRNKGFLKFLKVSHSKIGVIKLAMGNFVRDDGVDELLIFLMVRPVDGPCGSFNTVCKHYNCRLFC